MTICEKCGAERDYIPDVCPSCHFQPKTLRELATAALLTTQFEAGDVTFGTEEQALKSLSNAIRDGKTPDLDEMELLRHEQTVEAFLQVRTIDVYWALFRFFLPAILFFAVAYGVLVILRHLPK
jgi:hypothetical protein